MSDEPRREPALASGGPLDGTTLGEDLPERYVVAMADNSRHVYARTDRRAGDGRLYDYVGRE